MFKVAIGHSDDPDTAFAIQEIIAQCQDSLGTQTPQAGILLGATDFDYPYILKHISQQYPDLALIGGTSDGEMSSLMGFQQDSLLLVLFCSDNVTIKAGLGRGVSQNPLSAAQAAVQAAYADDTEPTLCLTVAESLNFNSVSVVESLKLVLGEKFPIFGGLAGDNAQFVSTYQFFGTEVLQDSLTVLIFSGPLEFSHGIAHGWTPIAKRGLITKTGKNALLEIDHQPALSQYDYYLDGLTPSPEYPIAIFEKDSNVFYLRAPVGCDRDTGSINFLVDLPEQVDAQIAHASSNDILQACEQSIIDARLRYLGHHPEIALIFSCYTRRYLLGTQTAEEAHIIQQNMLPGIPIIGFYSYGEIAALEPDSPTQLSHEAIVTLLIGT